jgi:hypothetical protein
LVTRLGRFARRQQAIYYVAPTALGIVHGTLHPLRNAARIERCNLCKIAHFAKIQNEALPLVKILLAWLHSLGQPFVSQVRTISDPGIGPRCGL